MKIGITNDHRGVELKRILTKFLEDHDYNVIDYGVIDEESVDYPDYAFKLGEAIKNKDIDFGISICRTGIGMSIALNKVKGVRCAKVCNKEEAYLTRFDNNANALSISFSMDLNEIKDILLVFLTTPFSNDERHIRRIEKIRTFEND